jgi:hypothetical protein
VEPDSSLSITVCLSVHLFVFLIFLAGPVPLYFGRVNRISAYLPGRLTIMTPPWSSGIRLDGFPGFNMIGSWILAYDELLCLYGRFSPNGPARTTSRSDSVM